MSDNRVCICHADLTIAVWAEGSAGPTATQIRTIVSLSSLSEDCEEQIETAAQEYLRRVSEVVNLPEEGIVVDPHQIGRHFQLTSVLVPRLGECEDDIFLIHGDCDWEEEHRLQFVVLQGVVVHCGPQDTLIWGAKWDRVLSADSASRKKLLAAH